LTPSLEWLLVFVPISLVADLLGLSVVVFITSALAIIPLAALIGRSTEQAAIRIGPRLGGLVNATLGNLTELIVGVLLVAAGNFAVVKASLIGSIVGNLLLVLGLSFAAGGVRHKVMRFNAQAAGVQSASLALAATGLVIPALLVLTTPSVGAQQREVVSVIVALILIVLYGAVLAFTQVTHAHLFEAEVEEQPARWSLRLALTILAVSALVVGLESELLVSTLEPALHTLHIPEVFVGLIVIPVIGNAAEHSAAVFFAVKNRLDATMEIAVGSSVQVAMFVAPVVVFASLLIGRPMDFVFTAFEIGIVFMANLIVALISQDGRSDWLEGVQLLGAYLIVGAAAFFVGTL
jgi:Ca2+:H+ antiporter